MKSKNRLLTAGIVATILVLTILAIALQRGALINKFTTPTSQNRAAKAPINIPFFVDHLVGSSKELTVDDLPSTASLGENLRNFVTYHDEVFAKDRHAHILEFTRDGQLVAMSDPNVLHGCANAELAVMGDQLFVACWQQGLYVVDLVSRSLQNVYTYPDDLDTRNMRLTSDGDQLWIGAFEGVYRLDTKQGKLFAYGARELGSGCKANETEVIANHGDVWVTLLANSKCSGGAAHYLPATDSWKFFGLADFLSYPDRIDFNQFLFVKNEVIAEYASPKGRALSKYDRVSDSWKIIAQGTSPNQQEIRAKYFPADLHSGARLDLGFTVSSDAAQEPTGHWFNVIFSDGTKAAMPYHSYAAIAPSAKGYWLMSDRGLETFNPVDRFPGKVVVAGNHEDQYSAATMFVNDDKQEVFVVSAIENDFEGGITQYKVLAFGLPDFKMRLEKIFPGDALVSKQSGAGYQLSLQDLTLRRQQDGSYLIATAQGFGFVINPTKHTINIKKP